VCWAAGPGGGGVLVTRAPRGGVAFVVGGAGVAGPATVSIPEVAVALDHIRPKGIRGQMLADRIQTAAWLLFAVATSVVAAAAWPVVSRRNLRQIGSLIYAVGLVAIAITLAWSTMFGWVVTLLACVFIAFTGLRNLDWTGLGRGIALYTSGTILVGVLAVLSIRRLALDAAPAEPGQEGWYWPAWQVASLLIAVGAVWIVIELWARARLLLRQIRPLHRTMVGRFPEVVASDKTPSSTQLKASDQVAQIMDALYVQSGGGMEIVVAGEPAGSVSERADKVARWARHPLGDVVVDARWIRPPEGMSPRGWVRAIARAFDATPAEPRPAPTRQG
uniref:hypothetical protein n=1 Tax=Nocardia wallacei TaxID=480035 RepID=UPI002458C63E